MAFVIPSKQNVLQQWELRRLDRGYHIICEFGFSGTFVEQALERSHSCQHEAVSVWWFIPHDALLAKTLVSWQGT